MNTVYAGVDPGKGGAIAFIDGDKVSVYDPPLVNVKKNRKIRKDYDLVALSKILNAYKDRKVIIYIEAVFSMTGQGVSSSFDFGRSKGIWEGMAHALEFEVHMVSPQTWKKEYGEILKQDHVDKPDILDITTQQYNRLSVKDRLAYDVTSSEYEKEKRVSKEKSKNAAMDLVVKLFPNIKDDISLKKHDGRAEAILIAEYGRRISNLDH